MIITQHAKIRMCERGLHVLDPTKEQIEHAGKLLYVSILENHPESEELMEGRFPLVEYSIIASVMNGHVLTVRNIDTTDTSKKLSGGIIKSGNKYAKKIKKFGDSDEPIKRNGRKIKRRSRKSPKPRE